jgi:Ni/Fe-hydrogenase subunit HybB-like protein
VKTEIEQEGWEEKEPLPARQDLLIGSESQTEGTSPRENAALWFGVFGSAVVWAIQLQTSYAMVPWACSSGHRWILPLVSLAFLAAAIVPGIVSWKIWRRTSASRTTERESAGAGRRRFMAMLGMMDSAIFVLLILAQGLPVFFIHPCLE